MPRFTLEPYKGKKSRHTCPQCLQPHCFAYYIDADTGEPLGNLVGRCNHECGCGYHKSPRDYFKENPKANFGVPSFKRPPEKIIEKPIIYVPHDILIRSLQHYERNNFALF